MTVGGFSASPPAPPTTFSRIPSITHKSPCPNPSRVSSAVIPHRLSFENSNNPISSSSLRLKPTRFRGVLSSISFRSNSSTGPGGPGPGEGDSRSVLDAFFLGKALAEAVNERVESAVGEFFSALGRLQAEQQKQVQDFQDDVLDRAKRRRQHVKPWKLKVLFPSLPRLSFVALIIVVSGFISSAMIAGLV
ncbi:hypothetical protein Vadar_020108 [Vaccinium darrowii]|uniref:Uncharacterized protein n=1 Tax=Vaccinium darrowii TaxID=229202 RepID=A0ACB7ZCZ8_9ERIC|nr:hypothetical protein Vadar_020108 [Vaccinium darrowii]